MIATTASADHGGTGLLAIVATICLAGVIAAAIRVILARHLSPPQK